MLPNTAGTKAILRSLLGIAKYLLILVSIASCTQNTLTVTYCLDTDDSKEVIVEQVEKAILVMANGIEAKNAEEIFSIFNTQSNAQYIRNGYIYPSIADAVASYKEALAKTSSDEFRKFYFKTKNYDIVNKNTVLFTGIGVIETLKDGKQINKPWEIGYTILWLKSSLGWKAINMHVSW